MAEGDDVLTALAFDDNPSALLALERKVEAQPDRAAAWCSLGVAHARAGRYQSALEAFRRALSLAPGHVTSTAYSGVCLHMLGRHEEAEEILDYEGMVAVSPLLPSATDEETARFNEQLLGHVLHHPTLTWELTDKAVRGGYQSEELFTPDAPAVIQQFRRLVSARLHQLLERSDARSSDATASSDWRLTCWAVSLERGGYQLPHVHPRGLLSGVYYVRVPSAGPRPHAGAIRFRRQLPWLPPAAPGSIPVSRVVLPRPGTLVVFPSYFWHDTVPFDADTTRVSLAFDLFVPSERP
ncbi:putative 2OG-Fe(II) oxygenase [Ideonella sp.]|uniref:putative 2OG-Fe(II) oxygenase n=1 Tax=Ideonella sp. TaxID=1929293 RepID=UPI0035B3BC06